MPAENIEYPDLEGELWRPIPEGIIPETKILVSNKGRICTQSGRKTLGTLHQGYFRYNNISVHRLVAAVWLADDNGDDIIHIDQNSRNNQVSNLEWVRTNERVNHHPFPDDTFHCKM